MVPSRAARSPASKRYRCSKMATFGDALMATPALVVRLAHEWLVTDPPQIIETRAGRQIGEGLTRTWISFGTWLISSVEMRGPDLRNRSPHTRGSIRPELHPHRRLSHGEDELLNTTGLPDIALGRSERLDACLGVDDRHRRDLGTEGKIGRRLGFPDRRES